MTQFHQTMVVPADRVLHLRIPNARGGEEVEVIVRSKPADVVRKVDLMRQASKDPLYLSDMQEIADDFSSIDLEEIP